MRWYPGPQRPKSASRVFMSPSHQDSMTGAWGVWEGMLRWSCAQVGPETGVLLHRWSMRSGVGLRSPCVASSGPDVVVRTRLLLTFTNTGCLVFSVPRGRRICVVPILHMRKLRYRQGALHERGTGLLLCLNYLPAPHRL